MSQLKQSGKQQAENGKKKPNEMAHVAQRNFTMSLSCGERLKAGGGLSGAHVGWQDPIPFRNIFLHSSFAGDAVFPVGFDHPDWYNGFDHYPEEAARVRVQLLQELAANRESLVATHLSFPSVCHVAVDGNAFRWVPGPWVY